MKKNCGGKKIIMGFSNPLLIMPSLEPFHQANLITTTTMTILLDQTMDVLFRTLAEKMKNHSKHER
jgi:hypothetical protein